MVAELAPIKDQFVDFYQLRLEFGFEVSFGQLSRAVGTPESRQG
jgi:hypothetical protein